MLKCLYRLLIASATNPQRHALQRVLIHQPCFLAKAGPQLLIFCSLSGIGNKKFKKWVSGTVNMYI